MPHWAIQSVFYHIYPLGCCGAPRRNDLQSAPQGRLERLYGWMDYWEQLGVNALYLGPLSESSTHGCDTADYFTLDRRLGTNETLSRFVQALHEKQIRVIPDAVFNHVGRREKGIWSLLKASTDKILDSRFPVFCLSFHLNNDLVRSLLRIQ